MGAFLIMCMTMQLCSMFMQPSAQPPGAACFGAILCLQAEHVTAHVRITVTLRLVLFSALSPANCGDICNSDVLCAYLSECN